MLKRIAIFTVVVLIVTLVGMTVLAHEHRHVGPYEISFGWRVEPALAGQVNGPEVFIMLVREHEEGEHAEGEATEEADHEHAEGEEHSDEPVPVEGAQLQVEVTFGPESITLPLRGEFGVAGSYIADLIPTLPGDYTFRVFGTIGDTEINETFSSADGEFSSVEPVTDVQFPIAQPDLFDLLARIEALEAEIAALKGE